MSYREQQLRKLYPIEYVFVEPSAPSFCVRQTTIFEHTDAPISKIKMY